MIKNKTNFIYFKTDNLEQQSR